MLTTPLQKMAAGTLFAATPSRVQDHGAGEQDPPHAFRVAQQDQPGPIDAPQQPHSNGAVNPPQVLAHSSSRQRLEAATRSLQQHKMAYLLSLCPRGFSMHLDCQTPLGKDVLADFG